MKLPTRIQRKRIKDFKLPPNTVCITRGTDYGNPFGVGYLMKMGRGASHGGFCHLRCIFEEYNDGSFVKVRDNAHAVELYREYRTRYPLHPAKLDRLRSADFIACFCKPGEPCHGDVLLEILAAKGAGDAK